MKHYAKKTYGGAPHPVTLASDRGGQLHALAGLPHWVGDWVGPRGGLDAVTTGHRTPPVQPVARRCTDWAIPIPAQVVAN
jgi:hypothetical protein